MSSFFSPVRLIACLLLAYTSGWAVARETLNFNPDWRFLKADPAGAEAPGFDDSTWERVSAPHTFNDTDTFDNWSLPGHRGEQEQWSGRTWYRKSFTAPADWQGKKVFIEFEAVRQVAEVYLNGVKLGTAKGGFTPFGFDLTPHLKTGANVLAVMADNRFMKDPLDPKIAPQAATSTATQQNLAQISKALMEKIPATLEELQADQIPWNNPHWHPAHGGIYRNVRLIVTDLLHITLPLYSFLQTEGPYAYATDVTEKAAKVGLEIPLRNERSVAVKVEVSAEILDAEGKSVATIKLDDQLAAGETRKLRAPGIVIPAPRLWEPAYPHLYRVVISLSADGKVVDTAEVPLGIRHIRWDTDRGLFVNGAHLKLQGWGQKSTNEWPGLGAALPDWMQYETLHLMQLAGGNFVRWGHVPGGPAQITAGDRLGIIALQPGGDGEHDTVGGAWALRVANFRDVLIYYRNNPSIFIWEGGNQKVTREHAAELRALMDQYDPHGGRAYAHRRADATTAQFMDVGIGTEGGREIALLPVVEGEYNREESPRRVWDNFSPPNFGYPEAKGQTYHLTSEQFAVNQIGHYVKKLGAENHSGGANWIFSDSTSGGRVAVEVARTSGEVDGVRLPKEAYFVTQVMFRDDPQVHIIGHWSYPAGTKKNVYVASNGDDVELFLNGKSLGHGKVSDRYLFTFENVVFEPGELKAVASRGGQVIATTAKHTVGPAVALLIKALPHGPIADGSDIALFDIQAVDAKGQLVPTFQQRVDFELTGPATWRGGYNSGKINSINHTYLDLEAGINRVAIRAGRTAGKITLTARSAGLADATVSVDSREYTGALPTMPEGSLVKPPPTRTIDATAAPARRTGEALMLGKFTKTISYTGPFSSIVHVEVGARDGKNAYVNIDSPFTALPAVLQGADWVQVDNRDALYSAVDLIEISFAQQAVAWVAHDNRLPRPAWLTKLFQPAGESIFILGQKMDLFQRPVSADESLTLGANTEDTRVSEGNLYLVFVSRSAP